MRKLLFLAIAVILVIAIAFYYTSQEKEGVFKDEEQSVIDYTKRNPFDSAYEEIEHETHDHEYEHYDYDELNKEGNGEEYQGYTLEEIYGEENVKQAKKVAESFLKAFHTYDGDNPYASVERAKKYMTANLYERLKETPQQAGYNDFYREFKGLKHHLPSDKPKEEDELTLVYYVYGINKNPQKEKTSNSTDVYVLQMEKENGEYKVNLFAKNVPFN